jgi:hypothetical protein
MVEHLLRWRKQLRQQMTWNDVADGIGRMTDQPPDSDRYLRPAVNILGEKFVEEMRGPLPHPARGSATKASGRWRGDPNNSSSST